MRYHQILHDDMRNGSGLRVVLFVSGCNHYCAGCHNPITWDPEGGLEFTEKELTEICVQLSQDWISGITFSGGDPLYPGNRADITKLCKFIKEAFPKKNIWMYTGYTFDQVKDLEVMNYIDVLVDGPFVESLADVKYPWAGSTNQRAIHLKDGKEV